MSKQSARRRSLCQKKWMLKSTLYAHIRLVRAEQARVKNIAAMSAKMQLQSMIVLAGTNAAQQLKSNR